MLNPVSFGEYEAQPDRMRMRIGIQIDHVLEQQPDESVSEFVNRVKETAVAAYGALKAYEDPNVNVTLVSLEE